MKINYDNLTFDSELEIKYYQSLKDNDADFVYQNVYKNKPIKINLGRRKTYTPDFVVYDNDLKQIVVTELKGYAKWSANEDNNICDFMKNKAETDKEFIKDWLTSNNLMKKGYTIVFKRLKFLKSYGFVDYDFKNPNTIAKKRLDKIKKLDASVHDLTKELDDFKRYYRYKKKVKLNGSQVKWLREFEKKMDERLL